eukprot:6211984-Pleurochrysis_carterae.AAC.1
MSVVETCYKTLARSHFGPSVDGLSACPFALQTHRDVTTCDLHQTRACYACLPFYRLFRFVLHRFIFILDDQPSHVHTDVSCLLARQSHRASARVRLNIHILR